MDKESGRFGYGPPIFFTAVGLFCFAPPMGLAMVAGAGRYGPPTLAEAGMPGAKALSAVAGKPAGELRWAKNFFSKKRKKKTGRWLCLARTLFFQKAETLARPLDGACDTDERPQKAKLFGEAMH